MAKQATEVPSIFDMRIPIPMRDGVERLPVETGKYPTILIRIPYVKELALPGIHYTTVKFRVLFDAAD